MNSKLNNSTDVQKKKIRLTDVYISSEGSDEGQGTPTSPFKTLNKAISNVNSGGTIHIANGVYKGSLNRNLSITKNITLLQDNFVPGAGTTAKIDAENADQIFNVENGVNFTLDHLTLANGMSRDVHYDRGGALANYNSNVVIKNCNFTGNSAHKYGGAISSSGNLTIENTEFISNSVGESGSISLGGAIYAFGSSGNAMVKNSVFTSNKANDGGGAVHNSGNLTIENTVFTFNNAEDQNEGLGGAIMNAGKIIITSSDFRSNTAGIIGKKGGGGAIANFENGVSTITCTSFSKNVAGIGAGAILNSGTLNILNSNLNDNKADQFGGAIVNTNIMSMVSSNATGNSADYGGFIDNYMGTCDITDSIFTKNHADINGGTFYGTETSKTSIRGSSLTNDNAGRDGGAIYNRGEFKIDGTVITSNEAMHGGGVYNSNEGFLKLTASKITQNIAKTSGGGVYNLGKFDKSHSSIVDNKPDDIMNCVFYVSTNGNDANDGLTPNTAKRTINNAVKNAKNDFIVKVAKGTYQENVQIDKNIKLEGDSQSDTIIDGNHQEECIGISDGCNVSLLNFTITNGKGVAGRGAGITSSGNSVIIKNTVIINNTGVHAGGIDNFAGEITIENSIISNNTALFGAGIRNLFNGTLIIKNTLITENIATGNGGAGIINYGTIYADKLSKIINNKPKDITGNPIK